MPYPSGLVALTFLALSVAPAAGAQPSPGVAVDEVRAGSALAAAGLQAGDVVAAWSRAGGEAPAQGVLAGPFDWLALRAEQAPRGPVELRGHRGGEAEVWTVPVGLWDAALRPALPPPLAGRYAEAHAAAAAGRPADAAELWEAMARELAGSPLDRAWLELQAGLAWTDARRFDEAKAALERAMAAAGEAAFARTVVLHAQGRAAERRNDMAGAEALYGEAAAARERGGGACLAVAECLDLQANAARRRGQLDRAHQLFSRALAIQEKLAPASLEAAVSLNGLGVVAFYRGDLATAEGFYRRALALRERLAPDSLDLAISTNNLGNVCLDRGQLAEAEALYRRALAIRQRLAPESMEVAGSHNNLGNVAFNRGDLAAAEAAYTRALAIKERLGPGSPDVGMTLRNLGIVRSVRGDYDGAGESFGRALEIFARVAPGSVEEAMCLYDLGTLAVNRADYPRAVELLGKTLAIQEKLAPDSYDVAATELNLGEATRLLKDLPAARGHFERALAIREKLAPGGLDVSFALVALAGLAREAGELERADALARRALAIREKLAPESYDTARTLHELGLCARARGRAGEAADWLGRAVARIEAQLAHLGGTREQQAGVRARFIAIYRDLVDVLVELGRTDEALGVLESSRARLMLALLAERDLVLDREVAAGLEAERTGLAREYDRVQGRLHELPAERDAAEVASLEGELRRLRERQERLRDEVREKAPRLSALRDPAPLDAAAVRASLPEGTLLVAFSTGTERTVAFWVTRENAGAVTAPIGIEALASEVRAWRGLVQRGYSATSAESLAEHGARLYDLLLRPLERQLGSAKRVVILPDGPLHLLPFGALVRAPARPGGRPSYLAQWRPLSVTVSATLLAELGRQPPGAGAGELVAFGDPVVTEPAVQTDALAARRAILDGLRRQGVELGPLPAARREVASLGRLWGEHASVLVGEAATEEQAIAIGPAPRYVHFACHGLVNERSPLDSSLVLSPPTAAGEGVGNGILQAWEVFERMRLDARLVTLSACETALGRELEGEGVVGLVRAFQYAGARAVVASLWSVADDSTAALMAKLYEGLHAGLPADRALQAAQLELLRRPVRLLGGDGPPPELDASSPFFWAAFQLYGDGR